MERVRASVRASLSKNKNFVMTEKKCSCGAEIKSSNPAAKRCGVCSEAAFRERIRAWKVAAKAAGTHCSRCFVKVESPGCCAKCRAYVSKWKRERQYVAAGVKARVTPSSAITKLVKSFLAKQGGCCAICGTADAQWHLDHVMPLCLGGPDSVENMQVLCAPCNLRKGRKDPFEFAKSMGRLF